MLHPSLGPRRLILGGLAGVAAVALVTTRDDGADVPAARASVDRLAGLASRPDLHPPGVVIRTSRAGQAPGFIFVGPKKVFGAPKRPGGQAGAMIVDRTGRVRWFKPMPRGISATDVRVQAYRGKPVLTYWEGKAIKGTGHGVGEILDSSYRKVATVHAGGGLHADLHEFRLTPQGTALITAYHTRSANLRAVGGPRDGKAVEGVVEEVDVATGRVLFRWNSLDHVPIADSYQKRGGRKGAFDYFHVNSVDLDTDGNFIVSSRHTWTVYKIDRQTGAIMWRLGGKHSTLKLGPGVRTAWQHDATVQGPGELMIFDNGAGDTGAPRLHTYSRALRVHVDEQARTATLIGERHHPQKLSSGTQGSTTRLPDGHLFVGWGSKGVFSEFSTSGRLLLDARVPRGYDSYRAYRSPWSGQPATPPALAAHRRGGRTVVAASWNGATTVKAWRVLAGSHRGSLSSVGRVAWDDLETTTSVDTRARYVAVEALGSSGQVLGRSATKRVAR